MPRVGRLAAAIIGVIGISVIASVITVVVLVMFSGSNTQPAPTHLVPNPSSIARINNEVNSGFNGQTSVSTNGSLGG